MAKKRKAIPNEKTKSRKKSSKATPQKRTHPRSARSHRGKTPANSASTARRAARDRPIDESRIDEVPPLRPVDSSDFDRIVAVCTSERGRAAAVRLATWFCAGLKALSPGDRNGIAYVQIDEPLGDDLRPFQGNIFFPSEAIVACVTGSRALVNDVCVRANKSAGRGVMAAGRYGHLLSTLPVWAIVVDDNLIVPADGYFSGLEGGLREVGWKVWVVDANMYSMAWGTDAEDVLTKLPLTIPDRKRDGARAGSADRNRGRSEPDEISDVQSVDVGSRWIFVLLRRQAGPTEAEWVAVFQAEEEAPDEEVDVRVWYYRLFEEEEPWIPVPEGLGAAARIETAFTADSFYGMPPFYRFDKAPTTRVGSLWRLVTPEGSVMGQFVVERVALVDGREVNEADAVLAKSREVPSAMLRSIGSPMQRWVFGSPRALQASEA